MDAARYTEVQARDLKPGDELLTRYYDSTGTYREADVPVESVKVFVRKVRLTFGGGWRPETVPATKPYGVKRSS